MVEEIIAKQIGVNPTKLASKKECLPPALEPDDKTPRRVHSMLCFPISASCVQDCDRRREAPGSDRKSGVYRGKRMEKIARWIASRIELNTRRLRRALRDHHRAELALIRAADRRALRLRLSRRVILGKEEVPIELKKENIPATSSIRFSMSSRTARRWCRRAGDGGQDMANRYRRLRWVRSKSSTWSD